jgi:DNA-binding transcriptional LysR family regulator
MHICMTAIDWDDLRFLLALSRHGTLTAAATDLRVTQPTVGRRLAGLERRLGAKLFRSAPQGAELTPVGEILVRRAERMEAEALEATRLAAGRDEGVQGRLTITASEWLIARILGPGLRLLLERHRNLRIDLVASARWANLARGDADIALRPAAFQQQAVFQRELARIAFGLYGSGEYLRRHGRPDFARGCPGQVLLVMDEDVPTADDAWLRRFAPEGQVGVRTNGREALAAMASAGIGLACLPRLVGDRTSGLVLLSPPVPIPERGLWLGVHRDVRKLARVRAVIEHLTALLRRAQPALLGAASERA